jgi:glycosyltransferase involved in cell wall biosynthesis
VRISVVIPAYKAEAFIAETLRSVLAQTHPVHEILVVDDGSPDRSAEVAERFGPPVRVLRQPNAGVSTARNTALEVASGEAVAFLDADDLWEPRKLEMQCAYLAAHPDVGAVAASFVVFGEGIPRREVLMDDAALRALQPIDFVASPRVHPSTLLCRREAMRAARFPDGIGDGEDPIYAAQIRVNAPIGAVQEVLMHRREHPGQATRAASHFARGVQARLRWAQEHCALLGLPRDVVTRKMFQEAANDVLARYWTRDLDEYRSMREQLLTLWPEGEPIPDPLRAPIPPRPLLRLKDWLDSIRGK